MNLYSIEVLIVSEHDGSEVVFVLAKSFEEALEKAKKKLGELGWQYVRLNCCHLVASDDINGADLFLIS